MQRLTAAIAALTLACFGVGIAAAAIGKSDGPVSKDSGRLAQLLDDGRSATVAALVAPADRAVLTSARLDASWAAVVDQIGPFGDVTHTYTVDDNHGTRHELEVLTFKNGTGTLSAWRTKRGITAMWLLGGVSTDTAALDLGRTFALDLTSGKAADVAAAFNATMRAGLPEDQLEAKTADVTAGFRGPAKVVAQVGLGRAPNALVETYLLYRNALLRVEMTLDSSRQIAGLYLRLI